MTRILSITLICLFLSSCGTVEIPLTQLPPPSHQNWTNLLQKHVSDAGEVDYAGFVKDKKQLEKYIEELQTQAPGEYWTREEKLAYWINAYNAFTVQLIITNLPLESIKDLNSWVSVPFVNTIWDKRMFEINGVDISLNDIEHSFLRDQLKEPRIHFAIVCASISCPSLRNEAYSAEDINRQLNEQARIFINDPTKNEVNKKEIRLSKIFSWFEDDFTENASLIAFINKYSNTQAEDDAEITYKDYNWRLNGSY